MVKKKGIGVNVNAPKETCEDKKCPFHGEMPLRGRMFEGFVKGAKMTHTATVMWERIKKIPKYERSEKRMTKIHAHNPPCINAQVGDRVTLMETRPLSKTKNFIIIEKLGQDIITQLKERTREQSQEVHQKAPAEDKKPTANTPKAEEKKNESS